jgi:hypothetical protein
MYHELITYTVYDFYDLELCTMYDSHDVYLRVIFAYTNLVDVIIFHGFFVLFTDF